VRRLRFFLSGRFGETSFQLSIDVLIVAFSLFLSFLLRFDGAIPAPFLSTLWRAIGLAVCLKIPVFLAFRLYRFSLRHVGLAELYETGLAVATSSAVLAAGLFLLRHSPAWGSIPRSVLGIDFAFTLIGIVLARLTPRLIGQVRGRGKEGRRAIVVGAGDAGAQLVRAIGKEEGAFKILGFVDDDPRKKGMILWGARVLGPRAQLPRLISSLRVETVLIAMPSAPASLIKETVELARQGGVSDIKILPYLSELYTGRVGPAELRAVRPEDLLKREPVRIETDRIESSLSGKAVLVTGAAGSIGSELCRQVLRFGAARLIALDFNETGLFDLRAELDWRFPNRKIEVVIADVRDRSRIAAVLSGTAPDVVYHAAAYKHVPLMEAFPSEAVRTNVFGTRNVLEEASRAGSATFVLISTDKAVNPTSVMGATKRLAEMLVRSRAEGFSMRCLAVRFGNVLGSRGSVLQTFLDQIEARRPITITDPSMRRYFMLTSEAVQLVLQASVIGRGGEVFVLDMGEPVRIVELAEELIRFYGLEPEKDVPIVYTGIRPGEKLFEELLTAEEGTEATAHERLFVARMEEPGEGWIDALSRLEDAALAGDDEAVLRYLRELVPRYRPVSKDGKG